MKLLQMRFVRFILVGAVNTIFGFLIYSVFAITQLPTWLVLLLSNVLGTLFNFVTTGNFVFKDNSLIRMPRFLAFYAITYFTYLFLIERLEPLLGGRILSMGIIVIPMTILSYIGLKFLVFSKDSK